MSNTYSNGSSFRFILEETNGNSREMPPSMSPTQVKQLVYHLISGGCVHIYEKVKTVSKGD